MIFHQAAGRVGLIDTAIKTGDIGYMQRQLNKSLGDVVVRDDGSVRYASGRIFQLAYGEDGFDAAKLVSVTPFKDDKKTSFVNIRRLAEVINAKYGYDAYPVPGAVPDQVPERPDRPDKPERPERQLS
jgi:hypothetical protein